VPVEGSSVTEDHVTVPYAKDHVNETPDIDADEISQETGGALYTHYGLRYSEARSETGLETDAKKIGIEKSVETETETVSGEVRRRASKSTTSPSASCKT